MDSPSVSHSYGKKEGDGDGDVDLKTDKGVDHIEYEGSDKKKHRSSKSRKQSSGDDTEDFDGSGRKRSSGDRYESRKRSGGSKQESDEDDYESRRESRSKQSKKKQEESSLEKLSTWYQDGDLENRQDGGDKLGSRGHGQGSDDSDKRKGKQSDHGTSQSKSRSKQDRHQEMEPEKLSDRDSKYSEKRESREKGHGSSENVKGSKRRWDDTDSVNKVDDSTYDKADEKGSKASDIKHDNARERSASSRNEQCESKSKGVESSSDKGVRSNRRDERRPDGERSRNRSVSEGIEEDEKASPSTHDDRADKEKNEQNREQRTPSGRDAADSRDRFLHTDEDGSSWSRDRSGRGHRSMTPDRGGRYGRSDSERIHGRSGRKDGNRGEALKISSSGYSNDNYDVIEIRTNPDYGRTEPNIPKRYEVGQQSDGKAVPSEEELRNTRDDRARYSIHGPPESSEGSKERYNDDNASERDQKVWREDNDAQGGRGREQKGGTPLRTSGGQSSGSGSQPPSSNQDSGSLNRAPIPVVKGSRVGRGGRGRPTGRDNQQITIPLPIMGSPFGPLGIPPPGPLPSLNPGMSPAPGPTVSPGVFIPPFSPQVVWPGARGIDMNMLGMPPALSPIPTGPAVPRFPNMGTPNNPAAYFNQPDLGRGVPSSVPGSGFNIPGPMARGNPSDKTSGSWVPPPRSGGPSHKAPSRGEQNDYSQNFVDTGMRPQNFIRELELTNVVEDYPKLRELIQKKDEIVAKSSSPPMYYKCDLREFELSPEFFGTKFDVILVDPPWEEYVHRAPGVADHLDYWTFEEILNLKIEAIADTPSFIFLWVGDGVGLEQGRQCLKKWGFRRCEDICWVKTNKTNSTPGLRHDSNTLFQHTKEHCLMGIKGTVRRSTDGHIIHANIDTDVIIAEEPPYGSTQKPEDMYRIVEHFALGRRRLELFGEDHNIRSGWLTVGKGLSSSNFNAEAYIRGFCDKDGKVWQGGGGRNPPPDAPHLVLTTPEIESLRPKSPMKNQQQMQQQNQSSSSISLTNPTSSNRRAVANSPQNSAVLNIIPTPQEVPSNGGPPLPWGPPAMDGGGMYGYGDPVNNNGEFVDFDPHRAMNLL